MATQELTHSGRKIVINVEGNQVQMTIDGETIPVAYHSESGNCMTTKHMPYTSHSSLIDLAKDVVDNVINKRV